MKMVRVFDRSVKTIKNYWGSFIILKGINNINAAWEEVSVNYSNGVWRHLLPYFMHDFTGFEPVENTVEVISRLAQEVGLDEVTAESVTEMLYSHGQQISNEDLEEVAKEMSQQKEEDKKKMKSLLKNV